MMRSMMGTMVQGTLKGAWSRPSRWGPLTARPLQLHRLSLPSPCHTPSRSYATAPKKRSAPQKEKKEEDSLSKLISRVRSYDHLGPSFFDLFKHYKVTPDINTCNLLINIYNDDNNMESAAKLLTEMEQHQMVPNLATFNSFLQGFYDRSDYRSAFSYWEKMKASKIAGDRTTYKLLFRMARDRARFYEIVKQLVVDFGDTEVRSKIVVAAIGVYGKLRDTERISFLFYSLGPNGFPPDAPVYSAMIECYAKLNMKQEALKFYEKMKGRGFFPSVTACNSIISIYGENEDIASIEKITQDMESRGMDVANVTSLLVDAYSRKKELVAQLEEDAEPKETST